MLSRTAKLACLITIVSLGVGCGKKSAEDTEREWNKTQENAQKYASKYPAAKGVIDTLTADAKKDFEEAKKADEKTKGDKMQLAVDKLGHPLDAFKSYEDEYAKLDALQHDKDLTSLSAGDFMPLDKAANDAKKKGCCILQPTEKSCSDLPGTCATGGPALANMGDLKAKLEGAISDMNAAEKALAAKKPKPATPPPAAPAGSGAAPAGSGSGKK